MGYGNTLTKKMCTTEFTSFTSAFQYMDGNGLPGQQNCSHQMIANNARGQYPSLSSLINTIGYHQYIVP
jgi:hypothetical protein